MNIVVTGDDNAVNELLSACTEGSLTVTRAADVSVFSLHPDAGAFFDLDFEPGAERMEALKKVSAKPVFINSVCHTLAEMGSSFIRLNGWPTFLKRNIIEASCLNGPLKKGAEKIIIALNKKIEWVPDIPGFISARVVSMIINEACFALQEKVSTRAEIDTAMKLGTNYPYGPFEWAVKIGFKNIYSLLYELSKINTRYQPCSLLQQEAIQ